MRNNYSIPAKMRNNAGPMIHKGSRQQTEKEVLEEQIKDSDMSEETIKLMRDYQKKQSDVILQLRKEIIAKDSFIAAQQNVIKEYENLVKAFKDREQTINNAILKQAKEELNGR